MVGPVAEDPQHREHEGLVVRDRHAPAYSLGGHVVERAAIGHDLYQCSSGEELPRHANQLLPTRRNLRGRAGERA